jgi:hypothetical protein
MADLNAIPTNPIGAGIWLAIEAAKLIQQHLANKGIDNNLTQAQAETLLAQIAQGLQTSLPTPEELEAGSTVVVQQTTTTTTKI